MKGSPVTYDVVEGGTVPMQERKGGGEGFLLPSRAGENWQPTQSLDLMLFLFLATMFLITMYIIGTLCLF